MNFVSKHSLIIILLLFLTQFKGTHDWETMPITLILLLNFMLILLYVTKFLFKCLCIHKSMCLIKV